MRGGAGMVVRGIGEGLSWDGSEEWSWEGSAGAVGVIVRVQLGW